MDRYSNTPEEEKDLAQTPPWFIGAAEQVLRFKFRFDACALERTAKAPSWYSMAERGQDALQLPWQPYTWCNPPYSKIKPWAYRCGEQAYRGNINTLLIPDKPETEYTRLARKLADTVYHMPFRLQFLRPDGTPFLDKKSNKQGPKFPVALYLFTPWGITRPVRDAYVDFREYKQEN